MSGTNRLIRKIDNAEGMVQVSNRAVAQHPANSTRNSGQALDVPQAEPMGLRVGFDPARLGALADDLEVDAFLDLSRRLIDGDVFG